MLKFNAAAPIGAAEPPPGVSISAIAKIGALVSDPARTNMLVALFDGRDLTARELADRAGVTPQTASGHLAKLLAAGLIRMRRSGRCHYHSLAAPEVVQLIQALHFAGHSHGERSSASAAMPQPGPPALVRKCRGHLAGALATKITDIITHEVDGRLQLSDDGQAKLLRWGLDRHTVEEARNVDLPACLDWSERRPHLSGRLGAAILDHGSKIGWLKAAPKPADSMTLTPLGCRGFAERFLSCAGSAAVGNEAINAQAVGYGVNLTLEDWARR